MCRVRHRTSAANAPPAIGTRPEFKAPFGLKKLETSGNYGSKRTSLFFSMLMFPKMDLDMGFGNLTVKIFPTERCDFSSKTGD